MSKNSDNKTTFMMKSKTEELFEFIIKGKKGIVMSLADPFVKQAIASMEMIRELHQSTLDIILVYNGNELSPKNVDLLTESFDHVYTVNLVSILSIRSASTVKGFAMKPFSILAALEYDQVILVDADVFFFQSPDLLFENQDFKEKGALFFRDRAIIDPETSQPRLNGMVEAASSFVFDGNRVKDQDDGLDNYARLVYQDLPEFFLDRKTMHIMESGVVVIDKRRNFLELLTVCLLNQQGWLHDRLSPHFYGDKELFWIGFEMARYRVPRNYFLAPLSWTGSIGIATPNPLLESVSICSAQIIHALPTSSSMNLDLMWMNGGLTQNKYSKQTTDQIMPQFKDWMIPQLVATQKPANTTWYFKSEYMACLECSLSVYTGSSPTETDLALSCHRPILDQTLYLLKMGQEISRRYI